VEREALIFVGTCDLAGIVRGKGFPLTAQAQRLRQGVGLAPSNIMMSAFGPIYDTPYGTAGDLMLVPDATTYVEVEFELGESERFYLGDILLLSGQHWQCCPRHFLRRALDALQSDAGLGLVAAFEQEFVYTGVEDRPGATYALDAWRRQGSFGEHVMAALRSAGLEPDSFLPEYGPRQYEMTIGPARRSSPARWPARSRTGWVIARSSRRSSTRTGSATAPTSISACATPPTSRSCSTPTGHGA